MAPSSLHRARRGHRLCEDRIVRYDAVLLDAGGVLLLPDPELVGGVLREAGVAFDADPEHGIRAHYAGITAVDAVDETAGEWDRYVDAVLAELGVPAADADRATSALARMRDRSVGEVWRTSPPGTREGLRQLAGLGAALAVVSNSDGSVEEQLRALGLCQVGDGDGVEMCIVVDSFVVEVEKPRPEIFAHALRAAGVAADRAVHVGDSVRYDVAGARAASIAPLHFDPFRLCRATDHPHATSLAEVARRVSSS